MPKTEDKNKSNRFARQCLAQALIELMNENRDFSSISVTDICSKAGFSRMAYYRNYRSKDEILKDYMHMLVEEFWNSAVERFNDVSIKSYEMILFAFEYFKSYRSYTESLINANLTSLLQDAINLYFDKYVLGDNDSWQRRYALYFYAGALYNIYVTWVKKGLKETPEEIARIVYARMNSSNAHTVG